MGIRACFEAFIMAFNSTAPPLQSEATRTTLEKEVSVESSGLQPPEFQSNHCLVFCRLEVHRWSNTTFDWATLTGQMQ